MDPTAIEVPSDPQGPSPWVSVVLADHKVGEVLDSGPVSSPFGAGEIVLTTEGPVVVDFTTKGILGAPWTGIGPAESGHSDGVVIAIDLVGEGTLPVKVSTRLAENIEIIAENVDETGSLPIGTELLNKGSTLFPPDGGSQSGLPIRKNLVVGPTSGGRRRRRRSRIKITAKIAALAIAGAGLGYAVATQILS